MNRGNLYNRVMSICIIMGGVAAWNGFFVPSVPASSFVKSEIHEQDMELQEQDMESVPELEDGFEQNDSLSTPDGTTFDSQTLDESVMDHTFQEEEIGVDEEVMDEEVMDEEVMDEEVLDEEVLDEIEGLENLSDENLEPPQPGE